MAKKADLLVEAEKLGLEVTAKNTIAEIEAAIRGSSVSEAEGATATTSDKDIIESREAPVAKAGKRSEKALKEAEEKAEKEARKEAGDTSPADPEAEEARKKGPKPDVRPRIERRGKKYQNVAKLVDAGKRYSLNDAVKLAVQTSPSNFDASLELHVRLGVDPRQADQNIRANVALPNGTGKDVRVAVFAPESEHATAKKAGASVVGDDTFIKQLEKENLDFDVLIATPQYMPRLGKYARLLGPRGLMPNPKSGTVSADVAKAVAEAKAGKVEYRVDKQATIHLAIGKVSFGADKLEENAKAFMTSLRNQKPSSLKGTYVKSISMATTMGPGIKVENTIS